MIASIKGVLIEKQPPYLVVETASGLAYELQVSMTTFYRLPEIQSPVFLYTHQAIREDAHLLFGFMTQDERRLFRSLIKVNGVGPKVALGLLSSIEPDALVSVILNQDSASLIRLPGIGRKTAERLLIEMKDRCEEWQSAVPLGTSAALGGSAMNDALSALLALGYKPQEASKVLSQVKQEGMSTEELIRIALKGMVPC